MLVAGNEITRCKREDMINDMTITNHKQQSKN